MNSHQEPLSGQACNPPGSHSPFSFFCSLWWKSFTVPGTQVDPFPSITQGVVFTACVVFTFFHQPNRGDKHPAGHRPLQATHVHVDTHPQLLLLVHGADGDAVDAVVGCHGFQVDCKHLDRADLDLMVCGAWVRWSTWVSVCVCAGALAGLSMWVCVC